jgi:phosphate acyltransferase
LITISLDVHGGDLPDIERLKGAFDALQERHDLSLILVGNQYVISKELSAASSTLKKRIDICHTDITIEMGESPTHYLKTQKN